MNSKWIVYILLCSDESLYTGITTDMKRRFQQHQKGTGAKYFRGRKPLQVVYLEQGHCRSSASKREAEIKAMSRTDKEIFISRFNSGITRHECSNEIPKADSLARRSTSD